MKNSAARRLAEARGWHVISLCQPAHLFVKNGRRLTRVAEPCDPWQATVADHPFTLLAEIVHTGVGATPLDAIRAAIPDNLMESLRRCELAVDSLHGCLQKLLREEN